MPTAPVPVTMSKVERAGGRETSRQNRQTRQEVARIFPILAR